MSNYDNNKVHDAEIHYSSDHQNEKKLPSFHYPEKNPPKPGK